MTFDPPLPALEVSVAIEYEVFGSREYNRDFKGRGTLTIRPGGQSFTFTGRPRKLFARAPTTITLGATEIFNVTVAGRMIRFDERSQDPRRDRAAFVFFCRDDEAAMAVDVLLPRNTSAEFHATRDFVAQLYSQTGSSSPWASPTNLIIGANVAVFLVMGLLGAGWITAASMRPYILYGANNGAATTDGEWWRLLTSMFMHYGLLHLFFNMWALLQAGHFLERLQGRLIFALTYLGSGLAGGFASILWHGDKSWSAGASGAVFGVYAAILGHMLRLKETLPPGVYQSMMKSSLTFAGYNLLFGLANPGIDNAAHGGGALGGLAFGWLLAVPLDSGARTRLTPKKLQLGVVAIAMLAAGGIAFTPRFDYRVKDELAWGELNEPFVSREADLTGQLQRMLDGAVHGGGRPDPADWITAKLVPFYREWSSALAALPLSSGRETDRRRQTTLKMVQDRIASYEHLGDELRNKANNARIAPVVVPKSDKP